MHDKRVLILLIIWVALATLGTLGVGHLSDDWVILSHVARHGNGAAWTGPWLSMGPESINYYRPLFSGLYAAEYSLFGTDPFWPHVHHALWHLAATLLLCALVRKITGYWIAGLLAGALFAMHPQLGGATGWIAARCGMVAGTLTLLTAVAWLWADERRMRGQSGFVARMIAVIAAATAVLSQESGYLALVTPLVLDLLLTRQRSMAVLVPRHLPFALAGAGLLILRFFALGTLGGGYPNPGGLLAGGEVASRAFENLGLTLLRTVTAAAPECLGENLLLSAAIGLVTLGVVIWGLLERLPEDTDPVTNSRGAVLRTLAALWLMQVLLLVLTSDPSLGPATGHRWYVALAYVCAMIATCALPLIVRANTWALCGLLVALYAAAYFPVQHQLREGDQSAKKVLRQVLAIGQQEDLPEGPALVSCLPEARFGIPTFHWGLREALNPPFQSERFPRKIYPIHRFMYLGAHTEHKLHPPIEALLYASNRDPIMITMRDPHVPHSDDLRRFDFTLPTGDPQNPYMPIPPSEVGPFIRRLFDPTPVTWGGLNKHELDKTLPLDLPLEVVSEGAEEIEIFAFLPTFDTRLSLKPEEGRVAFNLGSKLNDYIRFLDGPCEFFLLPLAWTEDRQRPRMGPLLTVRVNR